MSTMSMSSQPQQNQQINVDNYLSVTSYTTKGSALRLKDHTEFYASGSPQSKNGVIIIPDYWGWNTGRIRNICDLFGDLNCFAVIPNFSSRGVEGETQSYMDSNSLMDWYKSRTFDGNLKPVISSIVNFMKNEGVEKISLLGFSWGGWVAVNILSSELADDFVCAAIPHPSLDLEEKMYGGSLPDLMSRINRPVLLMPTKGDPESYKAFVKLLKFKLPTSQVVDYHDVDHGFLLRGNSDYESNRHAMTKSLNEIYNFFQQHYQMDTKDLVREADADLGQQAAYKGGRTWGQAFQEAGDTVKDYSNRATERIGETTKQTGEKIGETTKQTGERIGQSSQQTGDQMRESAQRDKSPQFGRDVRTEDKSPRTSQNVGGRDIRREDKPGL